MNTKHFIIYNKVFKRLFTAILALCLLIISINDNLIAQSFQTEFGKNRVQYHDFEWSYPDTSELGGVDGRSQLSYLTSYLYCLDFTTVNTPITFPDFFTATDFAGLSNVTPRLKHLWCHRREPYFSFRTF